MENIKRIYWEQLGCPKNQVDGEKIIYSISDKGIKIVDNPEDADYIVVNTCGFIEEAKKQSIETLFSLAEYKNINRDLKIISIGCLTQRYKKELQEEMSDVVDYFFGFNEYDKLKKLLSSSEIRTEPFYYTLNEHSEVFYVKISEGCDNNCTYCAIPLIRGKLRSRNIDDILEDIKMGLEIGLKK